MIERPGENDTKLNGPEPSGCLACCAPVPAGITEACGIASTYLNALSGWVRVICSEWEFSALMPATDPTGCLENAEQPLTGSQKLTTGDLVAGLQMREKV